jgi:hypothetical protein
MQIGALGKTGALRRGAGLDFGSCKFTRYLRSDHYNRGLKRMLKLSEAANVQDQNCLREMHQNFQRTPFEDSQRLVGNLSGLRPANCFRQQLGRSEREKSFDRSTALSGGS